LAKFYQDRDLDFIVLISERVTCMFCDVYVLNFLFLCADLNTYSSQEKDTE